MLSILASIFTECLFRKWGMNDGVRIRNILSDHFDLDVDTFDEEEPI